MTVYVVYTVRVYYVIWLSEVCLVVLCIVLLLLFVVCVFL